MGADDFDRVEVDHLIRELAAPPPKRAAAKVDVKHAAKALDPAASSPTSPAFAAVAASAADPAPRAVTQLPRLPATIRRSLATRVVADAMPEKDRWQFARDAVSRIQAHVPALPRLPRVPRIPAIGDLRYALSLSALTARIAAPSQIMMVRLSVGLSVALAAAMPYWPYPKQCAGWLLLYMFSVMMVVVAGIWAARYTWSTRLGLAHTLALCIVGWGISLGAEETLPRIGYAKSEAAWFCPIETSSPHK